MNHVLKLALVASAGFAAPSYAQTHQFGYARNTMELAADNLLHCLQQAAAVPTPSQPIHRGKMLACGKTTRGKDALVMVTEKKDTLVLTPSAKGKPSDGKLMIGHAADGSWDMWARFHNNATYVLKQDEQLLEATVYDFTSQKYRARKYGAITWAKD